MSGKYIRINGTGNAWPVPLGQEHPFYDKTDYLQLANVSFSIIESDELPLTRESILWEILVDAGHGIVQYLIQNENRLPDAVVLTHAHLDHTISLDWIIQSYYKHHRKQKKLPLYVMKPGWEFICTSFPQLNALADFRELKAGVSIHLEEAPGLTLTALPVYHGDRISGSSMLVFDHSPGSEISTRAVFTGDILCPLLRKADYRLLYGTDLLFTDANNRFPYLQSNHWSIVSEDPGGKKESKFLTEWKNQFSTTHLLSSHISRSSGDVSFSYFDEFLPYSNVQIPLSVFEFVKRIQSKKAYLVHYSGGEDLEYHDQEILNPIQLENWTNSQAEIHGITCEFIVPKPGDLIPFK